MFTGIVTAVGHLAAVESNGDRLRLKVEAPFDDLQLGESVAVNGACLTVAETGDRWFAVDVIETTRGRTTLSELVEGDSINLERAMAVGDRWGGHFVQGHVDGVAQVSAVSEKADALLVDLRVPPEVDELCVPHGSITVDGVSLTVNALPESGSVQIALIPFTRQHTTLGSLAVGDRVHVEGDMIGKYIRRLVEARGG